MNGHVLGGIETIYACQRHTIVESLCMPKSHHSNKSVHKSAGAYPGFRQGGGESVKIIIRSKIYNLGKKDR